MNWRNWQQLSPVLRIANFWDSDRNRRKVGPRYIEEFQLLYVQSGEGKGVVGRKQFQMHPGDLLFYGPGERHSFEVRGSEPLKLVGLAFLFLQEDEAKLPTGTHVSDKPVKYANGQPTCPLLPQPPTYTPATSVRSIGKLCEQLVLAQSTTKEGDLLHKRGLLLMLFNAWYHAMNQESETQPDNTKHRKAVIDAQHAIEANIVSPPTAESLADHAGLTRAYFARLFKSQTGQSISQYITFQRLSRARDLLVAGTHNVSEVAYAVGFEDPFYFSRVFTRTFGYRPSRLRATLQMG